MDYTELAIEKLEKDFWVHTYNQNDGSMKGDLILRKYFLGRLVSEHVFLIELSKEDVEQYKRRKKIESILRW